MKVKEQIFVYIASPFTCTRYLPAVNKSIEDYREQKVTEVAAKLKYKYKNITFFLPITQSAAMRRFNPKLKGNFDQWKDDDLSLIAYHCKETWVVVIKGWRESVGVQEEIKCAITYRKKVKYIDPKTTKFIKAKDVKNY